MTPPRPSDLRRPAEDARKVYAVDSDSSSTEGRCYLDDRGTVVCAFETVETALKATADDPNLRLVRHQSLSPSEQERVEMALLT